MSRVSIEIDDALIKRVMERYDCRSKQEAVDAALRRMDIEPFTREEILELAGTGWEGDLDELKSDSDPVRDWIDRD